MTTERIEAPRSARAARSSGRGINWEKWGWIYMRVSGVILVVLIFGHLFVNLVSGEGVNAIDFAFVAGKWADPFYIVWDTLLLWLALIHGANGMRTIVNDYASTRPYFTLFKKNVSLSTIFKGALLASTVILLILGTLVIYTFDPCLGDPQSSGLQEICAAK
ncbi:MAG: succinate dehydrogenase [Microbacteriaceae bacterium]|jgi:succinate dehydrogenase / fumarate reductase membrane anchor subunit|nr:succinate dehydrogenase [Microbacteriaceae bacterium]HEV7956590.1 succinate dehydrogenase hydrophobic membrane anchor subunit [Marisediminicola sp.]